LSHLEVDVFPGSNGTHLVKSGGGSGVGHGVRRSVGGRTTKRKFFGTTSRVVHCTLRRPAGVLLDPGRLVLAPRSEVSLRAGHTGGHLSPCGFASPSGVGAAGDTSLLGTVGLPADRSSLARAERRAGDTLDAAVP
jgi:hypothetical protein